MSTFTPGPWSTDQEPNEQDDYCIWAADGAFLANVGNGEKSVVGEPRPQGGDCVAFDITSRTNALLMAAAPDLYASSVTRNHEDDNGQHFGHGHRSACGLCAALVKARGET